MAGNIIVNTPSQGLIMAENFNQKNYKRKLPNLAGIQNIFIQMFFHWPRFSVFGQKKCGPNPSKLDIKGIIPAPTLQVLVETQNQKVFHNGER